MNDWFDTGAGITRVKGARFAQRWCEMSYPGLEWFGKLKWEDDCAFDEKTGRLVVIKYDKHRFEYHCATRRFNHGGRRYVLRVAFRTHDSRTLFKVDDAYPSEIPHKEVK